MAFADWFRLTSKKKPEAPPITPQQAAQEESKILYVRNILNNSEKVLAEAEEAAVAELDEEIKEIIGAKKVFVLMKTVERDMETVHSFVKDIESADKAIASVNAVLLKEARGESVTPKERAQMSLMQNKARSLTEGTVRKSRQVLEIIKRVRARQGYIIQVMAKLRKLEKRDLQSSDKIIQWIKSVTESVVNAEQLMEAA